jgi:hypothetical protein
MSTQQQVNSTNTNNSENPNIPDKSFSDFIKKITTALNISAIDELNLIKSLWSKFGNNKEYKLIINDKQINDLLNADQRIKDLEGKMSPYFKEVEKNWKSLLNNLGKLQALIFIKKLEEPAPDCTGIINEIVTALNNKISTVNTILENNIKISEKATQSKQKYLKYKSKYLHLKNNM